MKNEIKKDKIPASAPEGTKAYFRAGEKRIYVRRWVNPAFDAVQVVEGERNIPGILVPADTALTAPTLRTAIAGIA